MIIIIYSMEIRNSLTIPNAKGLFATKMYQTGEIIHQLNGFIYSYPTRETIYIGDNKHIDDKYGRYINHSFYPNIMIDQNQIIALCIILPNSELMFNYNENEINMSNPFYVNDQLVSGKSI